MKLHILIVVAFLAGSLLSQAAEYGYLSHMPTSNTDIFDDETITLNAGDRIEFLAASQTGMYILLTLPDSDTVEFDLYYNLLAFQYQNVRSVIVGPCELQMINVGGGSTHYASYKITRSGTENNSSYITAPSNPSGNFELKLQTSTDLQTWSSTTPGVFPYGDNAKFFRLVMETP
tara:strand:- start:476 stop:1000 length:525 start_codon:yes stop_codon:yes gene_type:complete